MLRGLGVLAALSVSIFGQTLPQLGSFTHEGRTVWYHVKEGMAVAERDIVLGPADGIDKDDASRAAAIPLTANGSIATWTQGQIPYVIDADVTNQRRIVDAVAHWNSSTPIRLVPRTGQANYVRFVRPDDAGYCAAFVGMRGGEQQVFLGDFCSTGNTIHEIGHAVGLLHEQDRLDRNRWITIQYENIGKFDTPVYSQFPATLDAGFYNYDSIMHYSPYSFSRNLRPVILTVPLGIPIAVRTTLSPGDIDTVSRIYGVRPTRTTIATMPSGLPIRVDGQMFTSPQSFDWAEGSTHTIAVNELNGSFTSATRHRFVRWTDGGALSHTVTASPNTTVIAAAFSREHEVIVEVLEGQGAVNVSPRSPDGFYPAGAKIRLNAIAQQGQKFADWATNFDLESYDIGYGAQEFEIDVYGNLRFGALFTDLPLTTIDAAPNDYHWIFVDGVPWTPPVRFAWDPGSSHTISAPATQFNDDGSMRYRFQNWADGSSAPVRGVLASETDITYAARYRSEAGVTIASTSAGRVAINPPTTDGYFQGGSTLLLRADPNADQDLTFWLGDINGRGKNRAMLMNEPRFAAAVFGPPVALVPFNAAHRRSSPLFDGPFAAVAPLTVTSLQVTGLQLRNPAAGAVTGSRVATQLEGFRVLFDGVPASILQLAPPNEIVVLVPAAVGARSNTLIEIERDGQVTGSFRVGVLPTSPGIYTLDGSGYGPAVAANEDGSPNAPRNPASRGSVVSLRVTGAGLMDRTVADGSTAGAPGSRPRTPIYVRINGSPAEVLSAEPVVGEVNGILDVKVRIPMDVLPGDVPVQFIAGVWSSPSYVTLSIR